MKVTSLIPIDKTKNSYSLIQKKNQKGFSTNSPLRVSIFLCDFISEKYPINRSRAKTANMTFIIVYESLFNSLSE